MVKLNLFIVADNALVANGLKHYLQNKFEDIQVTNFYDSRSCLKKINKQTQIVVIDQNINGKTAVDTLRSIKTINPETEVVLHTSCEDVADFLKTFKDKFNTLRQNAN